METGRNGRTIDKDAKPTRRKLRGDVLPDDGGHRETVKQHDLQIFSIRFRFER